MRFNMKNKVLVLVVIILALLLTSCSQNITLEDTYRDETFGYIDIKKDDIKILQLTDLHLTYGFDYLDQKTYQLIKDLIIQEKPDLIIVTGDLFMSVIGIRLIKQFINFMEQFKIPWSFIFGNHEIDYNKNMETIVRAIYSVKSDYLYFHHGPKLSTDNTHGHSNFKLKITNGNKAILNLYLFDSKAKRIDGVVDQNFPYDYLSVEQVSWYENEVVNDLVESLAFVHIPLLEFLEYDGEKGEQVWAQGKNTNLFSKIAENGKTKAVFVGHDHLNNFSFNYQGILLAYGNVSGYNAYGINPRGGRIINYNYQDKSLNTYLVLDSEV